MSGQQTTSTCNSPASIAFALTHWTSLSNGNSAHPFSMPARSTLIKVMFLGISAVFCLLLFEGAARLVFGRPTMNFGIEMWKYAKDVKLVDPNPEIGHRHRPNAKETLMGVEVQTNALGLRDVPRTLEKPPNTTRILALGDSITFGWGAPEKETFCARLEASLNAHPPTPGRRYEVINTGVGNSNTAMEVAWFLETGWKFQPDCLLVGWFINDAELTPVPSKNWLMYHSYGYVFFKSAMDGILRRSSTRKNYQEYYRGLYEATQPGWQKCQTAFAKLGVFCRERNIPVYVLLTPELHTLGAQYEFGDIHAKIRELCLANGFGCLELADAFSEKEDPRLYWASPTDDHPNGKGHGVMAAKIDETLRVEGWVK